MTRTPSAPRMRILLAGAFGALAFVGAACGFSSQPSGDVSEGPATGDAVQIVADDGAFTPDSLQLTAGEEVTIEIRNEDGTPHDFVVEALDLNTGIIEPGEAATATFTVPDDVTEFECTLHGGMSGRIDPA
jgi:plastocyanin